ncbi:MAG: HAMP domain-containing protein, partial [Gemmatimonadales bacterium]
MKVLRSLKWIVGLGMGVIIVLSLISGVFSITALSRIRTEIESGLSALIETNRLGDDLVSSALAEVRAAEQYLMNPSPQVQQDFQASGDSANALLGQFRRLSSLSTDDRFTLNEIASSQAQFEVDYSLAHALADLGRAADARTLADKAGGPADTLVADVRRLTTSQTNVALDRSTVLRADAQRWVRIVAVILLIVIIAGIGIGQYTVRQVSGPLGRLVGAAERFGQGDLRPFQLGQMPLELARLASAMDEMGARLRQMMSAVVKESQVISASASDFSAMSEQLAASSGEIS